MERFIKSNSYKKYLKENGRMLSDIQWLKVIFRATNLSLVERLDALEEIRARSKNAELNEKITEYLDYCRKVIANIYGDCPDAVYCLSESVPEDDYEFKELGIYRSLKVAEAIGTATGHRFRIVRHRAKHISEEQLRKILTNLDDETDSADVFLDYLEDGKLCFFSCSLQDNFMEEPGLEVYIESKYEEFPFDVENGAIISITDRFSTSYGIYHKFPDYEKTVKLMLDQGFVPEELLLIETMDQEGEFGHHHVLPTEFEVITDSEEVPEYIRDVILCASQLVKGKGTIDSFQYMLQAYKNKNKK